MRIFTLIKQALALPLEEVADFAHKKKVWIDAEDLASHLHEYSYDFLIAFLSPLLEHSPRWFPPSIYNFLLKHSPILSANLFQERRLDLRHELEKSSADTLLLRGDLSKLETFLIGQSKFCHFILSSEARRVPKTLLERSQVQSVQGGAVRDVDLLSFVERNRDTLQSLSVRLIVTSSETLHALSDFWETLSPDVKLHLA